MARKQDRPKTNGSKETSCARCSGTIAPYAGVEVSSSPQRFAHHISESLGSPNCADSHEREQATRQLALDGAGFAWSCRAVAETGYGSEPQLCDAGGSDRSEYAAHVKTHGARQLSATVKPARLRKTSPRATFPAPQVPLCKFLHWTERKYAEWKPGVGNELIAEVQRHGQFWSDAGPNSVWVIPTERAPWESSSRAPAPVELYLTGTPGHYVTDWSEARRARREVNRTAKLRSAA